jgi:HEAT repeat protein
VGLFDFFKRGSRPPDDDKPVDRKLASLGKTAADKRAQAYDREEAIRGLIEIGTPDAAGLLLKRFTLKVDPSITDQEEKQLAFDGIVSIGKGQRGKRLSDVGKDAKEISSEPLTADEVGELRNAVVERVRSYCNGAENLTLPLKVVRALLDDAGYQSELISLLSKLDTEYTRNVEPKINLLAALEELRSEEVRQAVEPYLQDVNETVRFHAVETTFKQDNPASIAPLVAMLASEESVRVKNKVAEGMMRLGWRVPGELLDDLRQGMRDVHEFRVTTEGGIARA